MIPIKEDYFYISKEYSKKCFSYLVDWTKFEMGQC